jgi:16S rRNA (adenine1518-N6/adenine1519-N6)-dimethyltransferase
MKKLTSVNTIRYIMEKYGFNFSKSLGQNFLTSDHVVNEIVSGSELSEGDYVLEVGPGIGVMTYEMAKIAKKVLAVEIDSSLIPVLNETLEEYDNIEIINQDVLKVDIQSEIKQRLDGSRPKVVANLPYYVTTPIIMKFLEEDIKVSDIIVMIQKEVADRINAEPGNKTYGALSVAVQFFSEPSIIAKVPKTVFMPQPKVDSTVIRLKVLDEPRVKVEDRKYFFKVVRAAFGKRRKTLLNALSSGLGMEKSIIEQVLLDTGIDPKRRGETLSIEEFGELSNNLWKVK